MPWPNYDVASGRQRGPWLIPDVTSPAYGVPNRNGQKDVGADPTGASDSSAIFQNVVTVNEASGGGPILVPPGTYLLNTALTGIVKSTFLVYAATFTGAGASSVGPQTNFSASGALVVSSLTVPAPGGPNTPSALAKAGGQVWGTAYVMGPPPSGSDDTAVLTALMGTDGVFLQLQPGLYNVSASFVLSLGSAALFINGAGVDLTTIKVANGTFTKSGTLFNLKGTGTFGFDNLTLDLNGPNQSWGTSTSGDYYKAISADQNNTFPDQGTLVIGTIKVKNASMQAPAPGAIVQGIAVNTYGCPTWLIDSLLTDACDYSLFITQAFNNTPCQGVFGSVLAHNPNNAVVLDEGGFLGPGWHGGKIIGYLDALCSADASADGLRLGQGTTTGNITVDQFSLTNGRYPLTGAGNTGSNSHFGKGYGKGCRGSFNLRSFDGSCSFDQLLGDHCAIGGITGTTVFATLEGGNLSGETQTIGAYICNNSANQAIQENASAMRIKGGRIKNGTTTVSLLPNGSKLSDVAGFNPVSITSPGVSTPLTNTYGCDVWVDFVAAAGGTTFTVAGKGLNAFGASAHGGFWVPAGTVVSYVGAPVSWVWIGT